MVRNYDELGEFAKEVKQISLYSPEAFLYINGDIELRKFLNKKSFKNDRTVELAHPELPKKLAEKRLSRQDSDSDEFVVIPKNAEAILAKKLSKSKKA